MPSQPISALGNQYVTFNPEQPELFTMAKRVWSDHPLEPQTPNPQPSTLNPQP